MASGLKDFLTKETAGLPNWAWAGVVIVGGGLGFWFVQRNNAANAAGSTTTSATGATDTSQAGLNALSQPSGQDYSAGITGGTNGSSPVYVVGSSNPPPPTPPPPNPPNPGGGPLIPFGQWSQYSNTNPNAVPFGTMVTVSGVQYEAGMGSQGRVWGVPGQGLSQADWNKISIPPKVLLYQNQQGGGSGGIRKPELAIR